VQINNQIPINWNTIKISIILFVSSLTLTIVFMRIFTVPLTKLIEGTEKITKGDYSVKVKNISNDELGLLSDTFNEMAESLKEKEFIRDTFGKVVDPEIRDHLLSGNISLGGENCDVTVMFCDIRGFTSLSENMKPEAVVNLLNQYFTQMGKCISKNHGVINKYIGDAVMAIFGAPVKSENHALDAYNAALEMKKTLELLNEKFSKEGLNQISFGIGLHSGSVLAGNIGAENRMEYTVIGDTVNTASRIESLCKIYNTDLLISETTLNKICSSKENIDFNFVADAEIRGKTETVKLYSW
jgi:adenylate cyclase